MNKSKTVYKHLDFYYFYSAMEAIKFTAKTKKLELVKVPLPNVTSEDVLIKVAFAGICGTDLHVMKGEYPCDPENSFTMGHEFSGVVVDIGPDVKDFQKGDHVAIDPNIACHCCNFCRSGKYHFCQLKSIGKYQDGGWAQYAIAKVEQVHKLPDAITLAHGALCEPFSCIAHGWDLVTPVNVGQNILILGAGIIGNLWAALLHFQGHRRVTVSEPNLNRLELLKKLDTGYTLSTPDQLKKNHEADPENYVFDLVIDCSGYPPAIEYAVTLLNSGGRLCIFGVAPPHGKVNISPFDIYVKEATVLGVKINLFSFAKAIGFIEAMGDRYLNYENLGIKIFALQDYKSALEDLKNGNISKAVFKL